MDSSTVSDALDRARAEAVPPPLLEALGSTPAYLVGGTVRDALLGRELGDIDIAVDAEPGPIVDRLGAAAQTHDRFGTATLTLGGRMIDIARTRRETYPAPGALPEVTPAPIRADLGRRDFTVNALAVPLAGELELLDPYDGLADLGAGLLRVIHDRSFSDDPTRGLRAARYAATLGFRLEPATERLLRKADLTSVSAERVDADLRRIAAEPEAVAGLLLLRDWGLLDLDQRRVELLPRLDELLAGPPWADAVDRPVALLAAAKGGEAWLAAAADLAAVGASDRADSELFELAGRYDDLQLAVARALGARWVDRHIGEWRVLRLSIDGGDLLAAGVPEGPAVGRGLRAALLARIDGRIEPGAEAELDAALAALDG